MDRLVHSLRLEGPTKPAAARRLRSQRPGDLGKAVLGGSVAGVTELLRQGADPNAATVVATARGGTEFRGTPLMAAFYHDKGGVTRGRRASWQNSGAAWKITRVISYDHAPAVNDAARGTLRASTRLCCHVLGV